MQKRSSKLESTRKFEQNRSCWKILTMVKVNGQLSTNDVCWRGSVTSPGAYVAGCEAQQARGARGWARDLRVRRVADTNGAWQRVFVRQKLPPARGGACDAVSGRSWLGFARDWLFCHSMPLLWQLDKQNDDIRELQGLWAWRRWLASVSDYWVKARVAKERRRCP